MAKTEFSFRRFAKNVLWPEHIDSDDSCAWNSQNVLRTCAVLPDNLPEFGSIDLKSAERESSSTITQACRISQSVHRRTRTSVRRRESRIAFALRLFRPFGARSRKKTETAKFASRSLFYTHTHAQSASTRMRRRARSAHTHSGVFYRSSDKRGSAVFFSSDVSL